MVLSLVNIYFYRKTRFEASRAVSWSILDYKQPKMPETSFPSQALRVLLLQMQNITFESSDMRGMQNFVTAVSTFTFRLSLPFFFAFLFFFLLAKDHFTGVDLVP